MEVIHCLFDTKGEVANSMLLEVNMRENNNALGECARNLRWPVLTWIGYGFMLSSKCSV